MPDTSWNLRPAFLEMMTYTTVHCSAQPLVSSFAGEKDLRWRVEGRRRECGRFGGLFWQLRTHQRMHRHAKRRTTSRVRIRHLR